MKKRLLTILALAALLSAGALAAFTLPAAAEKQTIYVKLPSGQVVPVTVDVPPGTPISNIALPGVPVPPGTPSTPTGEPPATTPQETPKAEEDPERRQGRAAGELEGQGEGRAQEEAHKKKKKRSPSDQTGGADPQSQAETPRRRARRPARTPMRAPDGSPTRSNPGFVDALPGPSTATGVPNFVIRKFRVPLFLLPIYQAAGIQYGVRWEVLAAINEIETDYGRNLNVSSAGALGWMQFIPSSWRAYGVDANKDGKKDPYNPVDAIFAAGRYLKAAGAEKNLRRAIFAYNHANWYVDSVMLRAKLITGVPADLIGSLTGLTEGRFPVYARARYADDLREAEASKRVKRGQNAANVVSSRDERSSIDVFARTGSPVVAVNDGVIKKIGRSEQRGALRAAPGRLRQHLHLLGPGLGVEVLSGAEGRHPGRDEGPGGKGHQGQRPQGPQAHRAGLPGPPGRQLRQAAHQGQRQGDRRRRLRPAPPLGRQRAQHRRHRPRQAAPVRPPQHARRARARRPRADCWTPRPAAAPRASRNTRTSPAPTA